MPSTSDPNPNSIRNGEPVNDIPQTTDSNLAVIAGRTAAYTGNMLKTEWVRQWSRENLLPAKLAFGGLPIPEVPVPGRYKLV